MLLKNVTLEFSQDTVWYLGQVNLAQEDLDSFLALAEELEMKGLTPGGKFSNADSNRKAMFDTQKNSMFECRQRAQFNN